MAQASADWSDIHFRDMTEADLPRVMDIEPRAYTFHWTEKIFRDCLSNDYQMCVMQMADKVIGYAVYSMVACESHLLNITIEPEYMGRGLGRVLLKHIISHCQDEGNESLFLEVRVGNEPARRLYRSEGFVEVGTRRNYYPSHFNSREDGIVMALALVEGGV